MEFVKVINNDLKNEYEYITKISDADDFFCDGCCEQSLKDLFEICDSNKILLTKCRRSSKELFELLQIDNIQNLEKTDFNTTPLIMTDLHLAYTNRKRKEINDIMM